MPTMSGIRMMERIAEVDPTVGAVYLLSFADIATVERPGGTVRVVNKPLQLSELVEAVSATAAARPAAAGD